MQGLGQVQDLVVQCSSMSTGQYSEVRPATVSGNLGEKGTSFSTYCSCSRYCSCSLVASLRVKGYKTRSSLTSGVFRNHQNTASLPSDLTRLIKSFPRVTVTVCYLVGGGATKVPGESPLSQAPGNCWGYLDGRGEGLRGGEGAGDKGRGAWRSGAGGKRGE